MGMLSFMGVLMLFCAWNLVGVLTQLGPWKFVSTIITAQQTWSLQPLGGLLLLLLQGWLFCATPSAVALIPFHTQSAAGRAERMCSRASTSKDSDTLSASGVRF